MLRITCHRGLQAVIVFGICILPFPPALFMASASPLSEINAQIARYGCNLPQYADSVPECRDLHSRARALSAQWSRPIPAPSYVAPVAPPPPQQRSGGFFSTFFGGSSPRYSAPNSGDYRYSPGWDRDDEPRQYGTFRTLCVRTCDGYYFPVSYSTVRSRFAQDEQICQASCQSDAKLFVHPNPGGDVEHAVTPKGERYADLPNAFRYREQYMPECRCKPDPWSEEAKLVYEQRKLGIETEPQIATAAPTQEGADAAASEAALTPPPRPLRRAEANHPAFRRNGFFSWVTGSW
ncbi:MAG: DUF2865 domain-containing protein [Pseudomonadota bacterium]|nr:DUF2865 domain-containing protein [Pseudomonadota bacterium]